MCCVALPLLLQLVHLYNMDRGLLPSRRMFGILGAPKQEHLLDMQTKLETMLMTAVQNFQVPPKELLKFVHYSFTVSKAPVFLWALRCPYRWYTFILKLAVSG